MCAYPISILLVDDDLDTQEIVTMIISHFEYTLTIASTARSAMDQISNSMPDIIMLDILLPDLNGYVVLKNIRNASANQHPKIVAITAYYTADTSAKMLNHGFDGYLQKPLIAATLIPYLQKLVAKN